MATRGESRRLSHVFRVFHVCSTFVPRLDLSASRTKHRRLLLCSTCPVSLLYKRSHRRGGVGVYIRYGNAWNNVERGTKRSKPCVFKELRLFHVFARTWNTCDRTADTRDGCVDGCCCA
jgi:hypothetical protein